MTDTPRSLDLEVDADPSAPAIIHAELRRWFGQVGVRGWIVDDLLVASDEICFESILLPAVTRLRVRASLHDEVIHLDVTSDRRRRQLRLVPTVSPVEVVEDISPELNLAYQVADTFAVRTLPDRTIVELTKALG
jgi:hypothetical protein